MTLLGGYDNRGQTVFDLKTLAFAINYSIYDSLMDDFNFGHFAFLKFICGAVAVYG